MTWEVLPSGATRPVEARFRVLDEHRYGFTAPGRDPRPAEAGADYARLLGGFCTALADLACTDGHAIDDAEKELLATRTHVVVAGLQTGAAEGWLSVPQARAVWEDSRAGLELHRPLAPDVNDR